MSLELLACPQNHTKITHLTLHFVLSPTLLNDLLQRLYILRNLLSTLEREIPPLPLHNNVRDRVDAVASLLADQQLDILQALAWIRNKRRRLGVRHAGCARRGLQRLWRAGMLLVLKVLVV